MRFGVNPYKHDPRPVTVPKDVTVAVLVFIPNLSGYFEQRLDILKLCIASILKHTDVSYDLMIFDNGSCSEVIEYLGGLYEKGIIQYLFLSSNNMGKSGAYNFIFSASPGTFVAYSDDDMLFHPGWLSATLRVFDAFPKAGMVSALPTWDNFGVRNDSTLAEAERDPEMAVRQLEEWPWEWVEEFAEGKGSTIEQYIADCQGKEIILLERAGVQAFATCTHCQFVCRKSAAMACVPLPPGRAMMDIVRFDERLDAAGYMRLSTAQRYAQHMGNAISPRVCKLAERFGLFEDVKPTTDYQWLPYAPPRLLRPLLRTVLRWSLPWKALYRAYHELFQLVSWKTAEDKQRLAHTLKTQKS